MYLLCEGKAATVSRKNFSDKTAAEVKQINERVSSHVAKVFHGHPGSGHIKVWRLTPLTLHVFVVVFLVFELWGGKKGKKIRE